MRDNKLYALLFISLLSLLISFGLLFTWGYDYFYNKRSQTEKVISKNERRDADANNQNVQQDSLGKLYANVFNELGQKLDSTGKTSDSIKGDIDLKLLEFYALKKEIATLLQNRNADDDLGLARQKIAELQQKTDELRNRNVIVEDENKRLTAILQQLNREIGKINSSPAKQSSAANNTSTERPTEGTTFNAFDLRLYATKVNDDRETETSSSQDAEKLVGSFAVKNNFSQVNVAEMQVVILQPDGQVLKSSPWESGAFQTREGKRIYSCKIKFDYSKGESKRLNFTLSTDHYLKGDYTMQVYYNGVVIGRTSKRLS